MKKMILMMILMSGSLLVKAQVKYGVQVSGALSTASYSNQDELDAKKKFKPGFGVGLYADFEVSDHFLIKPSLNYLQKGVKVSSNTIIEGGLKLNMDITANLNYLELPVLAVYKFNSGNTKFFVGVGPSVGYGLSGKFKVAGEIQLGPISEKETIKIDAFKPESEDGGGLKRFDASILASAGVEFQEGFTIQLSYLNGLSNISSQTDGSADIFKNRSFLMTIGYPLNWH